MKKINRAQVLADLFHDFIESREGIKRPGTNTGYIQAMTLYIRFLETELKVNESQLGLSQFNSYNVTLWMRWLRDTRGNDPATCNLRLGQIRAFFKWLKKAHPEHRNIYVDLKDVELFKTIDKSQVLKAISEKGIKALVAAPGTSTATGIKYTAMFSFQYGTAARTDEMLSIRLGELNLDCAKPNVTVTGKRRKMRVLNIPKKVTKVLKKYIRSQFGDVTDENALLFPSPSKGNYSKLSESGYNKQMDIYSHKAHETEPECPEHVHPHQLRHSWATHALDNGVSIYFISKYLGHESVETTMRYLGITPKLKTEAMAKTESIVSKNTKVNWKRTKKLEDLFKI